MQKNLYIFIHGIGSSEETWNQYIKLLKDDHDFNIENESFLNVKENCSNFFSFFNYDSPIIKKKIFFPKLRRKKTGEIEPGDLSIISHSNSLLSFIENRIEDYDNVLIFAHSMGGLIILNLLFNLIKESKSKLIKKIKRIILFATPLAGSENSEEINKYFNGSVSKNFFSYAVKELAPDSHTIVNIQSNLRKYKNHITKMNILYLYGSVDARIAKDSKTLAESYFSSVKSFQLNHTDIKEPKNQTSEVYTTISKFINKRIEENLINELTKYEKSVKLLEERWKEIKNKNQEHSPFIILESHYTNTIYTNEVFITHLKYKFKMMEDGKVTFDYCFIPFDKDIKNPIEDDDFYKNHALNRFNSKSYKINICPSNIPVEYSKPKYYQCANGKIWLKWDFFSETIPKNTEFMVEISISDKIDISNNKDAKDRRADYFTYEIDNQNKPHGVRYTKYQIETYNDTFDKNVTLPFEPWMIVDGKSKNNVENCQKNVYYNTWNWDFFYCDLDAKEIKFKLNESERLIKHGAPCN